MARAQHARAEVARAQLEAVRNLREAVFDGAAAMVVGRFEWNVSLLKQPSRGEERGGAAGGVLQSLGVDDAFRSKSASEQP